MSVPSNYNDNDQNLILQNFFQTVDIFESVPNQGTGHFVPNQAIDEDNTKQPPCRSVYLKLQVCACYFLFLPGRAPSILCDRMDLERRTLVLGCSGTTAWRLTVSRASSARELNRRCLPTLRALVLIQNYSVLENPECADGGKAKKPPAILTAFLFFSFLLLICKAGKMPLLCLGEPQMQQVVFLNDVALVSVSAQVIT